VKDYLLILICLLFSCSNSDEKIPENILSENTFASILKEIHLAEATFELHKTKGMGKAQNELANSYQNIYSEYAMSEEDFKTTLEYYSVNPEKLEKIYDKVLEELTKERTTLNP
jgi:predicted DNA-binding ArsR family transcriptional regulator